MRVRQHKKAILKMFAGRPLSWRERQYVDMWSSIYGVSRRAYSVAEIAAIFHVPTYRLIKPKMHDGP